MTDRSCVTGSQAPGQRLPDFHWRWEWLPGHCWALLGRLQSAASLPRWAGWSIAGPGPLCGRLLGSWTGGQGSLPRGRGPPRGSGCRRIGV